MSSQSTATSSAVVLRTPDVLKRLAISRPTLYRRMADGTLPRPVRFCGRNGWLESTIQAVIASTFAQDGAR